MSDREKEIQSEFAEAQLQVSYNDAVDFSSQIDNLNQEDVFDYFQSEGKSDDEARQLTQGTNFEEQVRFENIEAGDEFSRHRGSQLGDETYTSLHPTGSFLAQPDANPEQLGIPSKDTYDVTESFQATKDTTALVSTANDVESWYEEGETFTGGEMQYHVSTEDLDNFQKIDQFYSDESQIYSAEIDNQNIYSIDNIPESMNTPFPGPGKQPEPNPATIETPNDNSSNDDSSDDQSLEDLNLPSVPNETPTPPPIPTPLESSSWSSEDIDTFSSTPESSSWSSEDIDTSFSVNTSENEGSPSDAINANSAADGDSV